MQDHIENEQINLSHSFSNTATDQYALHCHPFFEVYYFIRGQVSYLVEGKRYEPAPHSILLLAPGTFHGVKVESSQEYERYALHFEKQALSREREEMLLAPFFGGVSGRKDIYYQGADGFSMAEYFDAMLECEASGLQGKLLPIRLESLLSQIVRMDLLGHTAEADVRSGTTDQIIRYLNRSLCEPVTLDSLSERFFLSKNHLNWLFKQATGTTVRNYLIHKRIAAAHEMLRQGVPAAIAAEKCGFGDYSAFFRAYKKIFGVAPSGIDRG